MFMYALIALTCVAQNFEVASIKPSAGGFRADTMGGLEKSEPGRFRCRNCTLFMLLADAFDVMSYQLSGPSWIQTERFDVSANIPTGTSEQQVLVMEQNLLTDRFKITFHHEPREMPIYELVVGASGPKFKEPDHGGPGPHRTSLSVPRGRNSIRTLTAERETMVQLAETLSVLVERPVVDKTGLKGNYNFGMNWHQASGEYEAGPFVATLPDLGEPKSSIFEALQEQLGLKLLPKTGPVDFVVIDHLEKAPTGN